MIPSTMHAVLLKGHGDLDMLEYREDVETPTPQQGDVLIKVEAAGVNNTDLNTRLGWYSKSDSEADATWTGAPLGFPRIQGIDVCGVIVAVGPTVDESRIGQRVLVEPCLVEMHGKELSPPWFLGSECNGGFAGYCVVASRHAHMIDCPLTSVELASFPGSYSTAENMLVRSNVQSTDRVLIVGASGGVGSAAMQLAKARGATVVAVTTSIAKADRLKDAGADEVVLQSSLLETPGSESVDVVVDLVAGPQFPEYLEVLKRGGRYAVSGAIAGPIVELDVRTLYLKDLSFFGCTSLEPEVFPNLVSYIQDGKIKPLVAKSYPLRDIQQAQKDFAAKKHVGKLVLDVQSTKADESCVGKRTEGWG